MASPETINLEELLAPISDEEPCGADLRADSSPNSVYYEIRDARHAAREAERRAVLGDEDVPDSRSQWRTVAKIAPTVLAGQSKDLTIASFYIEALVREHGFAGLRDGFHLVRRLAEEFWDGLYPQPDEDGVLTRVAPLAGLNGEEGDGTLIAPIANVPLTDGSEGPFSLWQYRQAGDLEQVVDADARSRRIEQGAVSLQMFEKAVHESSPEFFQALLDDLQACQDEFGKLCELLDEKCGDLDGHSQAPPSSNIRNALEECEQTIKSIARDLLELPGEEEEAETEGDAAAAGAAPAAGAATGAIQSREDAFRTLSRVADFFRRTEPHTPVSYALEQAVRWGRMPLPELLTELIENESTRDELFRLIGVKPPEEPE